MRRDLNGRSIEASNLDLVVRRMTDFCPLSISETDAIRSCIGMRDHAPGSIIVEEGERLRPLWFVSGWACRQRTLADGRRQIVNFILPGDSVGMHGHPAGMASCTIFALTAVRTFDGTAVARLLDDREFGGLNDALHLQKAEEEAILCDQIVRLGRRSAFERVSHLLMELHARLRTVGLAVGNRFEMPLTQEILADAVGLSVVHVNRTLQQMRREGVVEFHSGYVKVLEPTSLPALVDAHAVGE